MSTDNSKLSDAQRAELKIIFDSYDTNKDGQVTVDELKSAFQRMNLPMSDLQIADIVGKVDVDGNKTIDFDEFCARQTTVASKEMFEKYDTDGDGFLGPQEVMLMARDLGYGSISLDQAKWLISAVDANKDGKISYEEMKALSIAL